MMVPRVREEAKRPLALALALALITLVALWPVTKNGFIDYDDNYFILEQRKVLGGITPEGLAWAFTSRSVNAWHPLTWISHMLDVQLFGLDPVWHHLSSLAHHVANAALMFLVLRGLTGALWRSALVAALFALHPLHVESVNWVAERKDVLSTLLLLLTMAAWMRHLRDRRRGPYLLAVFLYALSLMAKPMAVSLPLLLLGMEWWPLGRFRAREGEGAMPALWRHRSLLVGKIPFLALALASGTVAILVRRQELLGSVDGHSVWIRMLNLPVNYATYLGKTFLPVNLAVIYPDPGLSSWPWRTLGALALLAAMTGLAWRVRARRPYLLCGWAWFVVTLLPVIGLVPVGRSPVTDHFTYLALNGIFMAASWGARDLSGAVSAAAPAVNAAACAALAVLALLSHHQAGYWRNGETLFRHAVEVTEGNWQAQSILAGELVAQNRLQEAVAEYRKALELNPGSVQVNCLLAAALDKSGRADEGVFYLHRALEINSRSSMALKMLGNDQLSRGNLPLAEEFYRRALAENPRFTEARDNLAVVLAQEGKTGDALEEFRAVLRVQPDNGLGWYNYGRLLSALGERREALAAFRKSARWLPDFAPPLDGEGEILLELGALVEAESSFRKALGFDPASRSARFHLAQAQEARGDAEGARDSYLLLLRQDPDDQAIRAAVRRIEEGPLHSREDGDRRWNH